MRRRKEIHKRKARSAPVRDVPLWLRRLDQVKAELKGTRLLQAVSGFSAIAVIDVSASI